MKSIKNALVRVWKKLLYSVDLDTQAITQEISLLPHSVYVGSYISGLPGSLSPNHHVRCIVVDQDFLFFLPPAREICRLPRRSLSRVRVEDNTTISKRLTTVTRLAFFGPFALAMPKKKKQASFYLLLDFVTSPGLASQAVFAFSGLGCQASASAASSYFISNAISHPYASPDQKCPFCAEIIKAEAIKCKHCGSNLPVRP